MVTASKRGDAFVFARFAKYTVGAEMIVLPNDKHFRWPKIKPNNYIDELVDAKLQKLRIVPSGIATDEEFLRRVYPRVVRWSPIVGTAHRLFLIQESVKRDKPVTRRY